MFENYSNVVAVMAHPDDAELLCLGTLLKSLKVGCQVHLIVACSGERGIAISNIYQNNPSLLDPEIRRQETIVALENTGINVIFLENNDGTLHFDINLITQIEKVIKKIQPQVIITHYVDRNGFDHQDHTNVGMATLNASYRVSSVKLVLQPQPHCSSIEFHGNYFVDITEVFDEKVVAIQKHKSQTGKYYLNKDYHVHICQQNALAAGSKYFDSGLLFERFFCNKLVVV